MTHRPPIPTSWLSGILSNLVTGEIMRRRDLVLGGAALATSLRAGAVFGQPAKKRAAVVIGVNRAGNLQVLSAAASGAQDVARWLEAENFEVKLFTDATKAVRVNDIFDAVSELVNRGTLDQ